ncbi:hypothetical protein L228DRAFT_123001 [Xylona heveae TC161]|uniref:Secreted protein n=1 Tax=Xylona heveae (strain CBS 132557 / TC161) TaxID=1328760 RepID=A0A165HMH1_XYLHT|nr:hypothetical protein L228DRAFT_123001 [Xylona heveae TC161]KZF23735.1 hypothetical protein L228DRAFT_123001 [Xylona heveae TC161]
MTLLLLCFCFHFLEDLDGTANSSSLLMLLTFLHHCFIARFTLVSLPMKLRMPASRWHFCARTNLRHFSFAK